MEIILLYGLLNPMEEECLGTKLLCKMMEILLFILIVEVLEYKELLYGLVKLLEDELNINKIYSKNYFFLNFFCKFKEYNIL
jgi:hypothetical protein